MSDDLPPSSHKTGKAGWLARLFYRRDDGVEGRADIAAFLTECRLRDLLVSEEHAMLQGVLKVSETQVRDIMVPRSHMVVLELDDAPEMLLSTIVDSGHSRFPVI